MTKQTPQLSWLWLAEVPRNASPHPCPRGKPSQKAYHMLASWGQMSRRHDPWPQGVPSLVGEIKLSHLQSYPALRGSEYSVCWGELTTCDPCGQEGPRASERWALSWSWKRAGCGKSKFHRAELLSNLLPLAMTSVNEKEIKFEHIWTTVFRSLFVTAA